MTSYDSILLTSTNNNTEITITKPLTSVTSATLPCALVINNSGKGIRVKKGSIPLNSSASSVEDYVLNNGESMMFTGFEDGFNTTGIAISCVAWSRDYNCSVSYEMKKEKVYKIIINGIDSAPSKEPPKFTVNEINLAEYVDD